jgi:hypothetical protein
LRFNTHQNLSYIAFEDFANPNEYQSPAYKGDRVNFKTSKTNYKSKRYSFNPPEKWLVFEDYYPAIVDRETWELAQKLRKTKRKVNSLGASNPLTGIMFCGECGAKMSNRRGVRPYGDENGVGRKYLNFIDRFAAPSEPVPEPTPEEIAAAEKERARKQHLREYHKQWRDRRKAERGAAKIGADIIVIEADDITPKHVILNRQLRHSGLFPLTMDAWAAERAQLLFHAGIKALSRCRTAMESAPNHQSASRRHRPCL